jgi:TonB family protein
VFSARPNAYTTQDVVKLEALAESAARTVQTARQKSVAPAEAKTIPSPEKTSPTAPPLSVSSIMEKVHPIDPAVRVLRWLVIGLAIPLLMLIGFDVGWHRVRTPGTVHAPQAQQVAEPQPQARGPAAVSISASPASPSPAKVIASKPSALDGVSSRGGLVIYQNGKVVYREFASLPGKKADSPQGQSVADDAATGKASLPGVQGYVPEQASISVASGITGGRLLKSVRPQYPTDAIVNKREGAVVLHGTVGPDGVMKDLKVVSGDPLLTHAAVEAVQQWQYEPYSRNGKPVDMPIDITIDFNLPK